MILTVTANPAVDRVYFVEDFIMGEVHRPIKATCTAGGKGLNVARVAKTLGAQACVMGFIGGCSGQFIKNETDKLGIINEFTQIEGETRTCVNICDKLGSSGEILEPGPVISRTEAEDFISSFEKNIGKYNIITVSGSLPKGLDGEFYTKLIRIAKENNKKIIVDTSGKTLEEVINAGPYMIKPNVQELSAHLGMNIKSDSDVSDALKELRKKGIEAPVVSLGKDGAAAFVDEEIYKFSVPAVKVKNTVGSGDSTIAGIAAGLDGNMPLIDSIRLGVAAGTANTQFEETGVVSAELVKKYLCQIKIIRQG